MLSETLLRDLKNNKNIKSHKESSRYGLVLFYIFVAISTIFLVNKSIINPKKRNFQTVYLALVRDKKVYVAEKVE